jgi:hypothetical protein
MPPPTRADGSGSKVLGCPDRFGKALRRMRQQRPQAVSNDLLGLSHDPVDQLFHGRDVMDKADDHSTGPAARVHVALVHRGAVARRPMLVELDKRPSST